MELRQLQVFQQIAREGTVGAAAIALDRAPSSVSEQLRSLEQSLGVDLFIRTRRGMRLTAAGERLRPWAQTLLDQAEDARRDVVTDHVEVRLSALETLMAIHVPRMLKRFAIRRPDVTIRTSVRANRADLIADVASGAADAGLILDRRDIVGGLGFAAPSDGLAFLDLERVPLSLVVGREHPLAATPDASWADIGAYPLVGNNPACSFWLAADLLAARGTERIEAGSLTIAKAWTVQGLGVALLPDFAIAPELANGDLVRLTAPTPELSLRLAWRADREERASVRELLYAAADPRLV